MREVDFCLCENVLVLTSTHNWLRSFTGMDIITGMDYRNGHYAMTLNALTVI